MKPVLFVYLVITVFILEHIDEDILKLQCITIYWKLGGVRLVDGDIKELFHVKEHKKLKRLSGDKKQLKSMAGNLRIKESYNERRKKKIAFSMKR